jgi:hypothetical protein
MNKPGLPLILVGLLIAAAAVTWSVKPKGMPVKEYVQDKIEDFKEVVRQEPDPFVYPALMARANLIPPQSSGLLPLRNLTQKQKNLLRRRYARLGVSVQE